jgi:hypothetical protein
VRGGDAEGLDCSKCDEEQKRRRGCGGGLVWKVGRYEHDGCPQALLTPDVWDKIEAWMRWKRFGPPLAGGWAEWPARLVDVVEALDIENDLMSRKPDGS